MNAMDSVASYIDTEIKGSQESVNAVADSMEKLAAAIYAGYDWDDYAYQASHSAWEGETGKAYDEWATCFNSVAFDLQRFSRKASEGVRAFADELRWQQDKMASLRRSATDAGLIVVDWYILHPDYVIVQPGLPPVLALKTCAADDGNGNGDLKARKRLVDKFEELNGDAENARSALSDSVRMYLTPWYQEAQEYGYLDRFFSYIDQVATSLAQDAVSNSPRWGSSLFGQWAAEKEARAAEIVAERIRSRSGNPAIRAGAADVTEEALDNALSKSKVGQEAAVLTRNAGWAAKVAPAASTTISTAFIGVDVYNSETPVRTLGKDLIAASATESLSGLVVSLAPRAGAIFLATDSVVATGGGLAIAAGAVAYYDECVPLSVQHRIEAGAKDMLDMRWSDGWGKWTRG